MIESVHETEAKSDVGKTCAHLFVDRYLRSIEKVISRERVGNLFRLT